MHLLTGLGFLCLTIYSIGALWVKNPPWVKVFAGFYLAAPALIAIDYFAGINVIGQTPMAILTYVMLMLYTFVPLIFIPYGLAKFLQPVKN